MRDNVGSMLAKIYEHLEQASISEPGEAEVHEAKAARLFTVLVQSMTSNRGRR